MEQTPDTFTEMREQMQQLRETLAQQKIVNERMLQRTYRQDLSFLRTRASRLTVLAAVAMVLVCNYREVGFSWGFFIVTELIMLGCLVATLVTNRHIPKMDSDLVTATEELKKFKMNYVNWLRIGIPTVVFWLSWMVTEVFVRDFPQEMRLPFLTGTCVGILLGLVLGLRLRRQIIRSAETLITSLENLKETESGD